MSQIVNEVTSDVGVPWLISFCFVLKMLSSDHLQILHEDSNELLNTHRFVIDLQWNDKCPVSCGKFEVKYKKYTFSNVTLTCVVMGKIIVYL